jgi:hypothetical protein
MKKIFRTRFSYSLSDNLKSKIENWRGLSPSVGMWLNGSWSFFTPYEAMRFLSTGVRLAASTNFYIPEILGRRNAAKESLKLFGLDCEGVAWEMEKVPLN